MSQATFHKILSQLETLGLDELQQLQQSVQARLIQQKNAQQKTFHQVLLNSGLVQQIKSPTSERSTERKLIQIQGKSISTTILEERR